ncbi:MAG: hypothetical protein AAGK01_04350, partial [Pseudomonadota bacterium]
CTNANAGSTTVIPSGTTRVDIVPQIGDVITCIVTNTAVTRAVLEVEKSSTIISDPTGSPDPKRIPGAIIEYAITVTNIGPGAVDADSIDMLDLVPPEMEYQTPVSVSFAEGPTPSGLDPFDAASMVGFTDQPGAAGPYIYTPGGSFDGAVTGIRIIPEGTMAGSTGGATPSFTVTYRMRIE